MDVSLNRWLAAAFAGLALGGLALYFGLSLLGAERTEADIDPLTACQEQMREFSGYPLLYAGPEVLGYQLRGCRHSKTEDRFAPDGTLYHPATDSFTFVYGRCDIPAGGSSCPIPVTIVMDPPCHPPIFPGVMQGTTRVRGVDALVKSDGSLRIEATSHKLTIYGPGVSADEREMNATLIAEALVPANALADGLTVDAPLSSGLGPSTVCS